MSKELKDFQKYYDKEEIREEINNQAYEDILNRKPARYSEKENPYYIQQYNFWKQTLSKGRI